MRSSRLQSQRWMSSSLLMFMLEDGIDKRGKRKKEKGKRKKVGIA